MKKEKEKKCIIQRIDLDELGEKFINIDEVKELKVIKPKILLHSCCGPCSTSVIERLSDNYDITVFFYNPNITDEEEYELRRKTQIEFIDKYNNRKNAITKVAYMEGPYEPNTFFSVAKGFEDEPEGGKRCNGCFYIRLEKTAETAKMSGHEHFATTLTVSPYKNYDLITKIGKDISMRYGLTYLCEDFKKKGGFQRSIELSKEYHLYRQHYCGCQFSNISK